MEYVPSTEERIAGCVDTVIHAYLINGPVKFYLGSRGGSHATLREYADCIVSKLVEAGFDAVVDRDLYVKKTEKVYASQHEVCSLPSVEYNDVDWLVEEIERAYNKYICCQCGVAIPYEETAFYEYAQLERKLQHAGYKHVEHDDESVFIHKEVVADEESDVDYAEFTPMEPPDKSISEKTAMLESAYRKYGPISCKDTWLSEFDIVGAGFVYTWANGHYFIQKGKEFDYSVKHTTVEQSFVSTATTDSSTKQNETAALRALVDTTSTLLEAVRTLKITSESRKIENQENDDHTKAYVIWYNALVATHQDVGNFRVKYESKKYARLTDLDYAVLRAKLGEAGFKIITRSKYYSVVSFSSIIAGEGDKVHVVEPAYFKRRLNESADLLSY